MFSRQQGPGADDVLQELDGEVPQVVVSFKVLAVLGDPVPHHGENSHGGSRACDRHLPFSRLAERIVGYFLERNKYF